MCDHGVVHLRSTNLKREPCLESGIKRMDFELHEIKWCVKFLVLVDVSMFWADTTKCSSIKMWTKRPQLAQFCYLHWTMSGALNKAQQFCLNSRNACVLFWMSLHINTHQRQNWEQIWSFLFKQKTYDVHISKGPVLNQVSGNLSQPQTVWLWELSKKVIGRNLRK